MQTSHLRELTDIIEPSSINGEWTVTYEMKDELTDRDMYLLERAPGSSHGDISDALYGVLVFRDERQNVVGALDLASCTRERMSMVFGVSIGMLGYRGYDPVQDKVRSYAFEFGTPVKFSEMGYEPSLVLPAFRSLHSTMDDVAIPASGPMRPGIRTGTMTYSGCMN